MTASLDITRAQRLCQLFLKLHAVMEAERENNWIRGVGNIIAILQEADENPNQAASLISEARQSYRSMNGGNGSFSDFHIWRDDFQERVDLNKEISRTTEAIWREFEAHA